MTFQEYADFDGLGLAELVAKGEITSAELVEEAIDRAERHNPTINALVYEMYDSARDAAREADSNGTPAPFRGVPFLLKDLLGNCTGVPTTCASRFLDGIPANHNSELVLRHRRAVLAGPRQGGELGAPAVEFFRLQGVRAPDRLCAVMAPGLEPWDEEVVP